MSQRTPAVVGLYLRESGQWRRIAEFRLTADGHASFRVVDPVEGLVARVWYHQGVDIIGEERTVRPEDSPAFLRALLQPFGFRDYRFRDDTHSGRHSANMPPRNGHAPERHDIAPAATDSDCERRPARPAAWRSLDADIIRF
ncbi:hypothetical protein GFY24_27680 [Nocardia sp. SYP-A9097]|uniref:hypothetical protein n=1 Tax=Nocardia sp. SYP-A9097 TaxID=2663237 RepID=UPI00129C0091|nr:hypothetical protein [Nocardia sp. SYP-A9097]MRH91177.1 hypothetical protein [Nocardia sp. SYP-A9097]